MMEDENLVQEKLVVSEKQPKKSEVHFIQPKQGIDSKSVFVAAAVSTGFFCGGLVRGWSSPATESFQGLNNSTDYALSIAPLNKDDLSWISSSAPLGAVLSSIVSSFFLQYFGRKKTLIISSITMILSFTSLSLAYNTESIIQMIISRFFNGFSVGLSLPAGQIYITEAVLPHVRGFLGSLPSIAMAAGILGCFSLGPLLPWHIFTSILIIFPVLQLFSILFLPQTPTFLILKGDKDRAREALKWLRGKNNCIEHEFASLCSSIDSTKRDTAPNIKDLCQKTVYQPLLIIVVAIAYHQWSGIYSIIFNTSLLLEEADMELSSSSSSVIVGLAQFVGTIFAMATIDKVGRKQLLFLSSFFTSMSNYALGLFFYMKKHNQIIGYEWISIMILVTFMFSFSSGMASVPFVLMGELSPNKLRSIFGGLFGISNMVNMFLAVKTFTNLESLIGYEGVFWMYGSFCLTCCMFTLIFVPETKGKTLREIEKLFEK